MKHLGKSNNMLITNLIIKIQEGFIFQATNPPLVGGPKVLRAFALRFDLI